MKFFIDRLKIVLRNKTSMFWTLLFPIVLATLFFMAFSSLSSSETFETFDIAVVEEKSMQNFDEMIDGLSKGEDKVFNVKYVSLDEAKKLLSDNKITGYIIENEDIKIKVKENGIEQTILKYIIDSYYQTVKTITNIAEYDITKLNDDVVNLINSEQSNFKDISNNNIDVIVIYFYTLLGMVCMYSSFFGIDAVNANEANLSKKGARLSISPVNKFKTLIISLLVALLISYVENLILLGYMVFILGISFGNQLGCILLLMLAGSLAGISMGMLVGASSRKSVASKIGISLTISMVFSFLAGMMVVDIRYIIADKFPLLAMINPVSMITDGLYSLYYYSTLDKYLFNLISLIIFSAVLTIISYIFIRRKKYDSI